jgi:hypothetical protein
VAVKRSTAPGLEGVDAPAIKSQAAIANRNLDIDGSSGAVILHEPYRDTQRGCKTRGAAPCTECRSAYGMTEASAPRGGCRAIRNHSSSALGARFSGAIASARPAGKRSALPEPLCDSISL